LHSKNKLNYNTPGTPGEYTSLYVGGKFGLGLKYGLIFTKKGIKKIEIFMDLHYYCSRFMQDWKNMFLGFFRGMKWFAFLVFPGEALQGEQNAAGTHFQGHIKLSFTSFIFSRHNKEILDFSRVFCVKGYVP